MRVFVPATMELLARWHSAGLVDADTAFAATPFLREFYASGDTEELEYAALFDAARSSLRLLCADPAATRRRVVLAVDAPAARPDAAEGRSIVRLDGPVRFDAIAAVHIDDVDTEDVVRAAAAATVAIEQASRTGVPLGDRSAQYAVEDLDARELLWYATQEIPDLLAES
jgi:hypothetical protein